MSVGHLSDVRRNVLDHHVSTHLKYGETTAFNRYFTCLDFEFDQHLEASGHSAWTVRPACMHFRNWQS